MPWNDIKPGESPFIAALEQIGIPGAADVMNAIVVTAVLSCLNSGMYTGSRMLFALARRGDAPEGLLEVNRRGVPVKAILLTVVDRLRCRRSSRYLSPDTVFLFLVNSSGAIALFVYLLIAVSELRMRRTLEREAPERLKVRMWLFPYLTYFAIAAMVVVIGSMALVDDVRSQLIPSFISLASCSPRTGSRPAPSAGRPRWRHARSARHRRRVGHRPGGRAGAAGGGLARRARRPPPRAAGGDGGRR